MSQKTVVIIGGGIAGTTCAEYIAAYSSEIKIILVAATDVIKTGITAKQLTKLCGEVNIAETTKEEFENQVDNLEIKIGVARRINADDKYVALSNNERLFYDKLCICTGALPKSFNGNNPHVMTIRDTDTVKTLQKRIANSKKIIVVGNGGIALELVFEVVGCEVVWCIKDDYIGSTFFDKGAATFLLETLDEKDPFTEEKERKADQVIFKRRKYEVKKERVSSDSTTNVSGSALGPDWCAARNLKGNDDAVERHNVHIEYNCEPVRIIKKRENDNHNVNLELSNKKIIGADLIIFAIGVNPNINFEINSSTELELLDGFISVDSNMRTTVKDIYAAGDICSPNWETAPNWFQMKLWTQASQFGAFAGKCIVENFNGSDSLLDFCFELFTHVTTFFGFKVVVLGNFNCQKLDNEDYEFLLRCTKGVEYIKLVMLNGRVQGAVLIGETDLEETVENLIINQIDVGSLGSSLLDPDIDIEDYFD